MPTITLKVADKSGSKVLLSGAIDREKKAIAFGISRTEKNVRRLLKSLGVKATGLDKLPRTEANELQLIELEGELGILSRLKDRKKKIDSMTICD